MCTSNSCCMHGACWQSFMVVLLAGCALLASCQSSIVYNLAKQGARTHNLLPLQQSGRAVQVMHCDSILVCISHICGTDDLVHTQPNVLSLCVAATQAQCQKDLKGLTKQIESKQADLEKAQLELQHQQKTEAAVQKRTGEAERRIQVCEDMGLVKED